MRMHASISSIYLICLPNEMSFCCRFHALGPIYYRSSNGAILVYDITDEDSFQKVKNWVKELKKMLGSEIVLAIVGNKIDLNKDRNVPLETAER